METPNRGLQEENKQLRQELQKYKLLLDHALQSTKAGLIDWHFVNNKAHSSGESKRIFGFEDDTEPDTVDAWMNRIHPEDRGKLQNLILQGGSDNATFRSEFRILHPSGKITNVHATGYLIMENDRAAGYFGLLSEISGPDLKNNETRRFLEAMMNTIPACVYISDSSGKILEVNDYAKEIWGDKLPASQFWDENYKWVGYSHETGRMLSPDEWATSRAITRGETVIGNMIDIDRFEGNKGTILNCAAPVRNEEGEIIGAVTVNIDITKHRESERMLEQTRAKYQSLIEANVDLIWETDQDGIFTYLSPQLKKQWNVDPAELLGKKPLDLVLSEEKEIKADEIQALKTSRLPYSGMLFKAVDGNGKLVYLEITGNPVYDEKGLFNGFRGTARDITRRTLAESALIESNKLANERLKEIEYLYLNLPIGLCVFDLDLRYLRVNQKLAEMNGFPVNEHTGKTIAEIIPSLLETAKSVLQKILETGEPQIGIEFSGSTLAHPGIIRTWSEDWLPVRDSNGKITTINVMVVEKTEEKKAQEKLQIALDNGNIGIWEWDLTTGEVKWDERMERMFGLEPGTFDWTHEGFESYIHEEDLLHIDAAIRKALKNEDFYEAVYRTKPRDGKSNYISSRALITRDQNGKPVHVSGVCFDVTDMKEGAERSLIALNEALLRSNNELQQFAYVASHDLQEPLRMVTSFTQLLQMQYSDKLDQKANEYINFAVDGSKRMYELINGLLAYSRVQTKGGDFKRIELEGIIQKVRENLMILINETGAEIESGKLPRVVTGDENQLIQLLQNLIENGIKFCNVKPCIRISGRTKDGMHIISVRDNGIGIESQYFDRIFRIFQRLHLRGEYKGTGIGLAICRRIVERHGGEIWVESVPGEGSTFSFSLPVKPIQ